MPTPAEQKALLFLGAVALVGGAVRLFGGAPPVSAPAAHERAGLTAQIAATESAVAAARAERGGKSSRKKPRSRGRKGDAAGASPEDRIAASAPEPPAPLDVDRASAEELDRLPGVGPSLAARIVADREANGAFGSLAALDAVSGVGPTLIRRLAPHVTFSGPRRPSTAIGSGGGARVSGRVVGLIGGRP